MAVATTRRATAPAVAPGPEATPEPERRSPVRVGMALFTVADAMLLGGLLAAYVAVRAEAFRWPPRGVAPGTYLPFIIAITVVMAMTTVQWAVYAIRHDDRRSCLIGLGMTAFLAVATFNAEWYSFTRLGFPVSRHAYGTMHFVLIGYHAFHVLAVIPMLGIVMARTLGGEYGAAHHDGVWAVARFWHYASWAWIVIFFTLVVIR